LGGSPVQPRVPGSDEGGTAVTDKETGVSSDGKLHLVYTIAHSIRSGSYAITPPYGWEDMTRAQRVRWAKDVVHRKDSTWVYVQIDGLPY